MYKDFKSDSILLAKHITEKKYYVLKKLTIKGGNNEALYSVLLNEGTSLINKQIS